MARVSLFRTENLRTLLPVGQSLAFFKVSNRQRCRSVFRLFIVFGYFCGVCLVLCLCCLLQAYFIVRFSFCQ